MADQEYERIVNLRGNVGARISLVGSGGTALETDIEFKRVSGAISENLIQVANNLTQEEGDVGRLASQALKLVMSGKCIVWIGQFKNIITGIVTAAYIYPDESSVIPAIMADMQSKELLREWTTWDQETFMTVTRAILGSAQAFDDLKHEPSRRALSVKEFNIIYQQDPTKMRVMPLEIGMKPK